MGYLIVARYSQKNVPVGRGSRQIQQAPGERTLSRHRVGRGAPTEHGEQQPLRGRTPDLSLPPAQFHFPPAIRDPGEDRRVADRRHRPCAADGDGQSRAAGAPGSASRRENAGFHRSRLPGARSGGAARHPPGQRALAFRPVQCRFAHRRRLLRRPGGPVLRSAPGQGIPQEVHPHAHRQPQVPFAGPAQVLPAVRRSHQEAQYRHRGIPLHQHLRSTRRASRGSMSAWFAPARPAVRWLQRWSGWRPCSNGSARWWRQ